LKRIELKYGQNVAHGVRAEVERAIVMLASGSGRVKKFHFRGGDEYEMPLYDFAKQFDPEVLGLLEQWGIISVQDKTVVLGRRGQELLSRYTGSADYFGAYLTAHPFLIFGLLGEH
jgi:hypothetical protein